MARKVYAQNEFISWANAVVAAGGKHRKVTRAKHYHRHIALTKDGRIFGFFHECVSEEPSKSNCAFGGELE